MTFNVEEKHAVAGGIAAAGLPVAMNVANVPIEDAIVSLADAIFEGDAGSAAFVTGLGFSVLGLGMIGAAVYTDIDDWLGVLVAGLGAGFLALGAQAFDVARGN